ncbi:hypothetical protein DPMN_019544, partial [Dreissena polymorpha]
MREFYFCCSLDNNCHFQLNRGEVSTVGANQPTNQPTNRPTNQQTNRQGKNNMSPTTISPGPFRFANAGRPARTGMMRRNLFMWSHYFPTLPWLKPVNNTAESR